MMPQKRNPDVPRASPCASAARMLGNFTTLIATLKGLPTSYNKDLQDDKRVVFDAVDTLLLVLPAVAGAHAEFEFKPANMRAAHASTMMATDLADYLVRRGATSRARHTAPSGVLIRKCEDEKVELHTLPLSTFSETHALFTQDVFDALSPLSSVEQREIDGGTGPAAVRAQLESAQNALGKIQ